MVLHKVVKSRKKQHASYCQSCCWATHPAMLTGYCLGFFPCDRCGRVAALAMVRLEPKGGSK